LKIASTTKLWFSTKEEPAVKGEFNFGWGEMDFKYSNTKVAWAVLNDGVGPNLEINEEESDETSGPMKVQPDRRLAGD
jgi:hypothetical protein